jgi:3-hydroxybutyryl-CoA dehydrogenase
VSPGPLSPRGPVAVVGAGTMGAGIAQVALEAGHPVRLRDIDPAGLVRAHGRIRDGLRRRAASGGIEGDDERGAWAEERLARLTLSDGPDGLEEAVAGAALVIEAAIEDLGLKKELFARIDRLVDDAAILATNTSALRVHDLAMATRRPERVLGLHFFNPAPVMRLVEVISHPTTRPDVAADAAATMTHWGKTPVACTDQPGFIVNRVNRPFTLEALRLLAAGAGTIESIDAAVVDAGFPMGPFVLMDLVGLDINLATARNLFAAFGKPTRFRPSPIQESLVEAGHLGRKTRRGFYRYDADGRPLGPASGFATRDPEGGPGSALDAAAISERVILAVVAEAWRALGDGVATADDIDLALRLGANHPFGPFAWTREAGPAEVALTLDAFAREDDDTFRPAVALLRAAAG